MDNGGYDRWWLTKKDIYRGPDELYLTRYVIIRTPWIGIYIHKFWISDRDVPHNHPWWFIAIPLLVGYREHFLDGTSVWRGPFRPKLRAAGEFHWVDLEKGPAWTLFIHFKRKEEEWGFLTEDGFVDHITYNESLGIN